MSRPPRFLFDECIGKPGMERVRAAVGGDSEFAYLCDTFAAGTGDDVWIPTSRRPAGGC